MLACAATGEGADVSDGSWRSIRSPAAPRFLSVVPAEDFARVAVGILGLVGRNMPMGNAGALSALAVARGI
ncbi:hypothetical protein ACQY0O_003725 [Thecaphora frezii]